jgi:hypothetical protein
VKLKSSCKTRVIAAKVPKITGFIGFNDKSIIDGTFTSNFDLSKAGVSVISIE